MQYTKYSGFLILLILFSCDPFNTKIEDQEIQVVQYEAFEQKTPAPIDSLLKVATWNVKFGGGRIDFFFDCHGDRVLMNQQEVLENMAGIAAKVRNMDADILFLQEVDIDSKRSAYVDQVQYLLDNTDYNYAVYASQWLADYVPSDGVGQVNSGNAILSKYPMNNAERIALPLIEEQSGIVQYFYLRRNILLADFAVNGKEIKLLNTHTSAYSTDGTKKQQLEIIEAKMAELNTANQRFIIGGDFNNLPQNSEIYCEFDDDVCTEESGYESLPCDVLLEELSNMQIYDSYESAIPQAKYEINQAKHATFTSDKNGFWNRKLDYIFTNGDFVDGVGLVHQGVSSGGLATMPLSDHAPITTMYNLNK